METSLNPITPFFKLTPLHHFPNLTPLPHYPLTPYPKSYVTPLPLFQLTPLSTILTIMNPLEIKLIKNPNQALRHWLIHCHLYYILNSPLISDADFDTLTKWLIMSWDQITDKHKDLISLDDLKAGSGFAIRYPLIVETSAWQILRELRKKPLPKKARTRKVRHQDLFEK